MPKPLRALCLSCVCFTSWLSGAIAQDRPDEAELFGAPASDAADAGAEEAAVQPTPGAVVDTSKPAAPPAAESGGGTEPEPASSRDDAILGGASSPMFSEPAAPSDPLSIGGQMYIRAQVRSYEDTRIGDSLFSMPSLLDVYFDARPNDRVRGYVLGRMTYDPTTAGARPQLSATEAASGSASLSTLFRAPSSGPRVLLDQLWLRFDIAHTVFVTAGKQHVRWGTGHVWSPTDYLHLTPRNPLEIFDARTGTTMIKLHMPVESKAWNFYAYGVAEGPEGVPTIQQLGGAVRGEFVFEQTELGLGAFAQRGTKPKFAVDVSTGIGDFDVFMEASLRNRTDVDRVHYAPNATLPVPDAQEPWETDEQYQAKVRSEFAEARYPRYRKEGYRPQFVLGLSYSIKYNDNDVLTLSAEYFYNPLGYRNNAVYPGLIVPRNVPLQDPATYFYLGQQYAALVVTMPSPFSLDLHSFTLSNLGNFSDRSFVTQLTYTLTLLTHLRLESFVAVHYGRPTGEFRLRIEIDGVRLLPAGLVDVGVALRLSI
ncbi:MAG TPA: hypothetical protein VJR89_14090 [Polyangiales bacterium]|nr:hypothetical protein [Polyangiales bacterium]